MLIHRALPLEPIFSLTLVIKSLHNLLVIKSVLVGLTSFKGKRPLAELARIEGERTSTGLVRQVARGDRQWT